MAEAKAGSVPAEVDGRVAPRGRMREAQREFTRTRLVDAAIEIFAERGYGRATVDEIADRAGATRATFYLHFRSKSDLLLDLMERSSGHFHAVYQDLSPIAHSPSYASVRRWLAVAMEEWKAVAHLSRPVLEAAIMEPEIAALLKTRQDAQIAELRDALRAGAPKLSQLDAEVFASILMAPLSHYFQIFLRGGKFDQRRVLDVMAASWMAVIKRARSEQVGRAR